MMNARRQNAAVRPGMLHWARLAGTPFADWCETDQTEVLAAAARSRANSSSMLEFLTDDDLSYVIALLNPSLSSQPGDSNSSTENALS